MFAEALKSHPLKMGMQGVDVIALQQALKQLGYPLNGTGYFGSATDAAVENFQRKSGLSVDGVAGPATGKALDAALALVSSGKQPDPLPLPDIGRPLHLQIAISLIGLTEGPGSRDNPELVKDIREVAPDYDHDSIPWCAGFVSLVLARAGLKISAQPLWALSYSEGWGTKLPGPALGAIGVKTRTGGGHVSIVAGRTASGKLAMCGGNQDDQVNITGYAESAFNKGFYYPRELTLPANAMIGLSHLPIVNVRGDAVSEA